LTSAGKAGKLVVVKGRVVAFEESVGDSVGSKGAARAVVAKMTKVIRDENEAIVSEKKGALVE